MSITTVATSSWGQNINGEDHGKLVIDASCSWVYLLLNFG